MNDDLKFGDNEDVVDPVPEPAPVDPAPVEPVVDPVPAPQPAPQPAPVAPAPAPQDDELVEFEGEVLNRMARHLRKVTGGVLTHEDAQFEILTNPETNAKYKYLRDVIGQF